MTIPRPPVLPRHEGGHHGLAEPHHVGEDGPAVLFEDPEEELHGVQLVAQGAVPDPLQVERRGLPFREGLHHVQVAPEEKGVDLEGSGEGGEGAPLHDLLEAEDVLGAEGNRVFPELVEVSLGLLEAVVPDLHVELVLAPEPRMGEVGGARDELPWAPQEPLLRGVHLEEVELSVVGLPGLADLQPPFLEQPQEEAGLLWEVGQVQAGVREGLGELLHQGLRHLAPRPPKPLATSISPPRVAVHPHAHQDLKPEVRVLLRRLAEGLVELLPAREVEEAHEELELLGEADELGEAGGEVLGWVVGDEFRHGLTLPRKVLSLGDPFPDETGRFQVNLAPLLLGETDGIEDQLVESLTIWKRRGEIGEVRRG